MEATTGRVLVVDDDALFGRALRRMLQGVEVHVTQTGADALERLRQEAGYELILCDVNMPGMGGAAFLERVQLEFPGLRSRVVFMTGGASNVATYRFLANVNQVRLEKPFQRDDVLALLRR